MSEPAVAIRTETNGPMVSGIVIGFLSATTVFMALRFYARGVVLKNIGMDDWTMLAATVSSPLLFRKSQYSYHETILKL